MAGPAAAFVVIVFGGAAIVCLLTGVVGGPAIGVSFGLTWLEASLLGGTFQEFGRVEGSY